MATFLELRYGEVLRISLLRRRVNSHPKVHRVLLRGIMVPARG
jgi:hypothetical protein